jgi:cyclophilin family peptidyl-prolyl cis-trans isomerase
MTAAYRLWARLAIAAALILGAAPAQAQGAGAPVYVQFKTTLGSFTIELDSARAPLSVANFSQYVQDKHYDGTIFHRVVGGFVVQGGGFLPDGQEKPTRPGVPNESGNGLSNRRGTVAIARTGDPHSGTAQFYVNLNDNLSLDPSPARWGYAVFGRVVQGMEIIDTIARVPTGSRATFADETPLEPVVIESAQVMQMSAAAQ